MCGIVGFASPTKDISECKNILNNMNEKISKRGPDEDGTYYEKNICMAHKRLIVIDPNGGKQPMKLNYQGNTYTIVYNGQLYNTNESTCPSLIASLSISLKSLLVAKS